jgi:hypothetical protein
VSYAVGLALGRFLSGSPLLPGRGAGGEGLGRGAGGEGHPLGNHARSPAHLAD